MIEPSSHLKNKVWFFIRMNYYEVSDGSISGWMAASDVFVLAHIYVTLPQTEQAQVGYAKK